MTVRPTALGYVILAGFVGAGVYAVTRKSKASVPVTQPTCVIEALKFGRWAASAGIGALWLPDTVEPPTLDQLDNSQWRDAVRRVQDLGVPLVIATSDTIFYDYSDGAPRESSAYRNDYCVFV